MNWSRIKTILISALLVANIILGLYIYNLNIIGHQTQNANTEKLVDVFSTKDIVFEDDVLRAFDASVISVNGTYEEYNLEEIGKVITTSELQERDGGYFADQEQLYTTSNILKYNNRMALDYTGEMTIEEAIAISKNIISACEFGDDYEFYKSIETDNQIQIVFKQKHDEYYINGGYMSFIYNGDMLYKFERKWMILDIDPYERNELVPIDKKLFEAISHFDQGDKIVKIDLGYSFSDTSFRSEILSGELMPYYMIEIEGKEPFLIRALD